jgi:signal transduction histidine kinase/PAS domain-containing protein
MVLIAWSLAVWRVAAERDLELERLRKESSNLVRAYEEQVVRSLQAIDQTMLFLKSEYEQRGAALDFSRYLREGRVMQGIAHLLMVIDEQDQVVLATSPLQALDVARHEYEYIGDHATRRGNELLIGRPVFGRVSNQWRLPLSRRLDRADGSYAGVVVASVDPAYFSDFHGQVDIGRLAAIELVGRDGIVRARRSGQDNAVGQDLSDSLLLAQATQRMGGHFEASSAVDGTPRVNSFRVIGDYGLIAAVGIALEEGLAQSQTRASGYLWGAAGFSLFILLFGFALNASLRRAQRAHHDLRQSQKSLAEAQRIAKIGNWELDLTRMIGHFSPETGRILGLPEGTQELSLREGLHFNIEEDRPLVMRLLEKAADSDAPSTAEWRIRHQDEVRWLAATAERFAIGQGRYALRGTVMDITPRKRQEQAAERERGILHQIASGAPRTGVFTELCAHLAQQCQGARVSLLLLNETGTALRHTAAPSLPEEFTSAIDGMPVREDSGPCGTAAASSLRVVIEDMHSDPRVGRYRGLAESFGLRACTSTPIIAGTGQVLGTFALYWREVHAPSEAETEAVQKAAYLASIYLDRERSEQEVHQLNTELEERVASRTAELQAVNRELEAFSYSVSHDLRAPLRAIDGFSAILLQSHAEQLDEPSRNLLARIVAAAQRMGRLIDDMLALARVNRSPLHFEHLDLAALARTVAEELAHSQPERQVEFAIAESLPDVADPNLIRVVLENLLGNAWKFTRTRNAARIEFSMAMAAGERVYCVRDNGVGFDMVYADKLFGPFQRLHRPEEFPGTGIGLATVQRLIHRHRGRIWAESRQGHGAAFYFTLDARAAATPLKRAANA